MSTYACVYELVYKKFQIFFLQFELKEEFFQ